MPVQRLLPTDDARFPGGQPPKGHGHGLAEGGDLCYRIELWNHERSAVEMVLAITSNSNIGIAAFYAAAKTYPDRYITLRDRDHILIRWPTQNH